MKWKVLPLLMFAFFTSFVKLSAQVNTQDSLALVELYNTTDGPHWFGHSNWLSGKPVSSWYGVTVVNNRVDSLNLRGFDLSGPIPASLGNLTGLRTLNLMFNNLTDTIPSSLGNLTKLQELHLSSNQLSGIIPSSFGNLLNLQWLHLTGNKLTGNLPSSLGNLSSLRRLELAYNQLSGSLPSSMGKLVNLGYLYLDHNNFTDTIPSSVGNLSNLYFFDLGNNQLTGSIPSSIGNLSNLQFLYFFNNQLSGTLPSSLANLSKLAYFTITNNKISGTVPSALGNISSLQSLSLSKNQLSGDVQFLTNNINLFYLNLSDNKFVFNGIESLTKLYADSIFVYSPQANIPLNRTGNQLSVSAGGTLTNNTYKWYKDATLVSTKTGDSTFIITTPGKYNVAITNAVATDLTLYSDTLNALTLPLTLLSFTGTPQKNTVNLQWQTVNEINTHQFAVEHSGDGLAFTSIGTLAALNNPGNHNYTYTDANPFTGANYYRLKMVDKDGYFTFSRIIQVKMGDLNMAISIYPNPVKNTANLLFTTTSAGKYTVNITDLNGKLLTQVSGVATAGLNKVELNIRRYAAGTYFVVLTDEKGNRKTLRLVK